VKTIMNISLQITANLALLMEPFLPFSAQKLRTMLNMGPADWQLCGQKEVLKPGHTIHEASLLFQKIEDAEIQEQLEKLQQSKKDNQAAAKTATPAKENITFDEFTKMDIRTGTILEAEKVAKTKKLLQLKIDTGLDQRTVVSGIAEFFQPEDIIGRQVSIMVNLAPRKIKGIESQGMILMAEDADGQLVFVSPASPVKNGSEIK